MDWLLTVLSKQLLLLQMVGSSRPANLKIPTFSGPFEVTHFVCWLTGVGGGSNFGVVYEFVIKLFPHPGLCFGGSAVFTPDKIPGIVAAVDKLWQIPSPDIVLSNAIAALPPTFQVTLPSLTLADHQPVIILSPFVDTTDEALARQKLADFYALEPLDDQTKVHSYAAQNANINALLPDGPRTYAKCFAFRHLCSTSQLHNGEIQIIYLQSR